MEATRRKRRVLTYPQSVCRQEVMQRQRTTGKEEPSTSIGMREPVVLVLPAVSGIADGEEEEEEEGVGPPRSRPPETRRTGDCVVVDRAEVGRVGEGTGDCFETDNDAPSRGRRTSGRIAGDDGRRRRRHSWF